MVHLSNDSIIAVVIGLYIGLPSVMFALLTWGETRRHRAVLPIGNEVWLESLEMRYWRASESPFYGRSWPTADRFTINTINAIFLEQLCT